MMLVLPAIVIPITVFDRRLCNVSRHSADWAAEIGAMVTEVLLAMKVVRAFYQGLRLRPPVQRRATTKDLGRQVTRKAGIIVCGPVVRGVARAFT